MSNIIDNLTKKENIKGYAEAMSELGQYICTCEFLSHEQITRLEMTICQRLKTKITETNPNADFSKTIDWVDNYLEELKQELS